MRKSALFGAWLIVLLLATGITWQIVGAAQGQVSERPASPLNVGAPALAGQNPDTTTTTDVILTTPPGTTGPSSTETTDDPPPSTTVPTTTETTTTTVAGSTTTTTSVGWQFDTTVTAGGTVVVKYRPGEVVLQSATPAPGFAAELDKLGPPEVDVEFESESLQVEYRARWEDEGLKVEVSEE